MAASGEATRGDSTAPSDDRRARLEQVRRVVFTPMQFAPVLVAPLFIVGQRHGFVSDLPWPVLVAALLVTQLVTSVATFLMPPGGPMRWVSTRVALMTALIGVVIYLVGWGGVLAVGFVFAAAENIRVDGARAGKPAIFATVVVVASGELAIALGWVPSLLPQPEGHGLAVLATVGACMLVVVLAWTTHGKERAEESLRRSEERFRALVQHGSDVIIVTGLDGGVSYVSPAFERVLGHAAIDLASISSDLIHPEDLEDVRGVIEDIAQEHGALARFEARLRHADGDWRWFEVGLSNHLDDENVRGLVGNMRDITERRRFQEALHFQAYHDSLTSLPNRDAFLERLEDALRRARVERHVVGVLFLDVDRFKLVNDSLGHSVGDELLIDVAARVRDCLRPGDFVARFGGDEFTVLVDGLHDGSGAVAVAERITGAFRQPMQVSGRELFVSTSIGIAVAQNGDAEPGDLLRHADLAMYLAKDRGRSRWELFDAGSEPHVTERLELEGDLWRALESGELVVHFQPEVELDTGIVSSVEALVRWQHPRRGLLMPGDFVPVAEESSLIVAIDRYVLGVACAWARRWRDERGEPLIVGVNLSPRFMRQPDAVGAIRAMVEGSGCSPRSLRLEITERTALTDVETTVLQLHQLRALGIGVAIDDFGTGYSSLGYLKRLPVDVVKLDRTFVEGTDRHDADVAIAQAVITMGHALGMRVVAEGVERAEQALRLRAIGCDGAQGWHWSPAVNPEAVVGIASQPFPLPGGDDVESGTVLSFPASRR